MRQPYAHSCAVCGHILTKHGLTSLAPSVYGPYRCAYCPCEINQDAPRIALTKSEYEELMAEALKARAKR